MCCICVGLVSLFEILNVHGVNRSVELEWCPLVVIQGDWRPERLTNIQAVISSEQHSCHPWNNAFDHLCAIEGYLDRERAPWIVVGVFGDHLQLVSTSG